MSDDYISNFQSIATNILFNLFRYTMQISIIVLIILLILLAIGCLIKSQRIKTKLLIVIPILILIILSILLFPIVFVKIQN